MTTAQEDYIILASNVKSYFDTNTIANFRTKLACKREFPPNEDWRVGVTEITYRQTWFNVTEKVHIRLCSEKGDEIPADGHNHVIEPGFYDTVQRLIDEINLRLSNYKDVQLNNIKCITPPELEYDTTNHIVSIFPGEAKKLHPSEEKFDTTLKYIPILGPEIDGILGFIDSTGTSLCDRLPYLNKAVIWEKLYSLDDAKEMILQFKNQEVKAFVPADINAGFNNLYIYCNIVQHSNVGDALVPILTTIPNHRADQGWGGSIHHEPKNSIYRRLQMRTFDTIEIDIKDDSGKSINFKSGNVIIKLHFYRHG